MVWHEVSGCLKKNKVDTKTTVRPLVHLTQIPHSYYFTTRILVLKFVNKGVLFEEIQDSHFHRKRGYFGTQLLEFGEKGVNFDVQCFTMKKWGSFRLKSQCFTSKRGLILDWKVSVLSWKRSCFELKSQVFCRKRGGYFQSGEQGWVPLFAVSEGAVTS